MNNKTAQELKDELDKRIAAYDRTRKAFLECDDEAAPGEDYHCSDEELDYMEAEQALLEIWAKNRDRIKIIVIDQLAIDKPTFYRQEQTTE